MVSKPVSKLKCHSVDENDENDEDEKDGDERDDKVEDIEQGLVQHLLEKCREGDWEGGKVDI